MKKEAKKVERDMDKVEKDRRALEKDMDKLEEDQRKYEEARDIEFRRVHGATVISDADRRIWDEQYLRSHPFTNLSITTGAPLLSDATSDSSATHDKIVGKMHENNGKIQEKIGRALNKPEMEASGQAKQVQGMAEQAIGESKSMAEKRAKEDEKLREEREKERKNFLEAREREYQRIYGSVALSELDRQHWNTGYLVWYRRAYPDFCFSDRSLMSEIERQQWLDNFELERQRYEAEEQRRRLAYQQSRDADFLRTYGNRVLTADERAGLENDHLVTYRKAQKNPGFMVPLTVIDLSVARETHSGNPRTAASTGSHDVQVGKMHERNGKIQEKMGAVFHDPVLEAHGQAKQTVGQNEQLIGEEKKIAEDRLHELKKANAV